MAEATPMQITILDDYQNAVSTLNCFSKLNGHRVTVITETLPDTEALAEALKDTEALVLIRERTTVSAELLSRLPKLKLISQTGKISQHLNLQQCTDAGVAVAEGIGSPVAPAELCWALIMAASRQLPSYIEHLQHDQWQQNRLGRLGKTLHGRVMGIWGFGRIGQLVAGYAKAFGMDVVIWGSDRSRAAAVEQGFRAAPTKTEFFSQCDVLSLHLRLNDATRGIVTAEDLCSMKPDALLVNVSRAELIQTGVLYQQLIARPTQVAAIDVFEQEPADHNNEPLLTLPNVVATPHLGYVEQSSYELYFSAAFDNVLAFADGRPTNIANPEVLAAE